MFVNDGQCACGKGDGGLFSFFAASAFRACEKKRKARKQKNAKEETEATKNINNERIENEDKTKGCKKIRKWKLEEENGRKSEGKTGTFALPGCYAA
jgi:hypothetical protein